MKSVRTVVGGVLFALTTLETTHAEWMKKGRFVIEIGGKQLPVVSTRFYNPKDPGPREPPPPGTLDIRVDHLDYQEIVRVRGKACDGKKGVVAGHKYALLMGRSVDIVECTAPAPTPRPK
jgi:hypothetical protein